MERCDGCGSELVEGAHFCGECGSPIAAEGTGCQACGATLLDGAKFCGECGSPITEKPSYCGCCGEQLRGAFCEECGASCREGTEYCRFCGQAQPRDSRFCASCGARTPQAPGVGNVLPRAGAQGPVTEVSTDQSPQSGRAHPLKIVLGIVLLAAVLVPVLGFVFIDGSPDAKLEGGGAGYFDAKSSTFQLAAGDVVDISYSVGIADDNKRQSVISIGLNGNGGAVSPGGSSTEVVTTRDGETNLVAITIEKSGDYYLAASGKNMVFSISASKE